MHAHAHACACICICTHIKCVAVTPSNPITPTLTLSQVTHDLHIKFVAYIFAFTAAVTVLTDGRGGSDTNGTIDLSADLGDQTRRLASRGPGDGEGADAQEDEASQNVGVGGYTPSHLDWQLALSLFCALSVLIRSLLWPFQVCMHVYVYVYIYV